MVRELWSETLQILKFAFKDKIKKLKLKNIDNITRKWNNSPQKSELKKVAHVLSEAFMDYPMMQYFLPNEENRKKNFHVLWETSVNYAWKYGDVMVTEDFAGVLLSLNGPISPWKMILSGVMRIPLKLGISFIKRQDNITKIQNDLEKEIFSRTPCLYLSRCGPSRISGTRNWIQIASHFLSKAKELNQFLYLETVQDVNVKIYKKLGFKLRESFFIPAPNLNTYSMTWSPREIV